MLKYLNLSIFSKHLNISYVLIRYMFEQAIEKTLLDVKREKSFIDKLLAKDETQRAKELISKPKLKREELLEMLYLVGGTEQKLVNYSEWTRYVALKFFVWIREFVKCAEHLYDFWDDLKRYESICRKCEGYMNNFEDKIKDCKCPNPKPKQIITKRTEKLLYNSERSIEHMAKFLVDLFYINARSSLSIGATGFYEILTNRFEMGYPKEQQQEKGGLFNFKKA